MKWYASKKVIALVVFAFLSAVFSGYFLIKATFFDKPITSTYVAEDGTVYERTNILLLGVDARPGETKSRTDTIIVASIDPKSQSVAFLSIPRDTLVDIPGHGENKINAANVLGGVDLTEQVVEELLGVQINYHVLTNFDGFKDIINTLGGVNLDVEKKMVLRKEKINLEPGLQKLDGDKALQYVRFRSDAMGDIGRTQRQQKFLKAIANEVLQLKTVVKLPKLVPQISDMVETNMSVTEMAHLAKVAKKLKTDKLVAQTLPGNFYNQNGISYWKVDEVNVKDFVHALLTNGVTADVIDSDVVNRPSNSDTNKQTNKKSIPKEIVKENTKPVTAPDKTAPDKTGTEDTGTGDAGTGDAGTGDTGTGDAGTGDTGTGDAGTGDTGTGDAGTGDTGTGDTETGNTGTDTNPDTGSGGTTPGKTGAGSTK